MALAVQDQAGARQSADLAEATYPILADPDHAIAGQYGVFNLLNDGVAAPSVFIINVQGRISWSYIGGDIGDRPAVQTILENLPD